MANTDRATLLSAIAGILLAFAHPPYESGVFVFLGLLAFLGMLAIPDISYKKSFLLSFFTGIIYFAIVLQWYWAVDLTITLGISSRLLAHIVIFLVWSISTVGMGVFWGIFGYFARKIIQTAFYASLLKKLYYILTIASVFVLAEFLRSLAFSIIWFGSESIVGPHWTLGHLAYSLADNSIALWLAPYIGTYGIVFLLVALISWTLLMILRRRTAKAVLWTIGLFIILGAIPTFFQFSHEKDTSGREVNYAIVQTSEPSKHAYTSQETLQMFNNQLESIRTIASEYPQTDIIVMPEGSNFITNMALFLDPDKAKEFFANVFKHQTLIVSGARIKEANGNYRSRVFSLDTNEGVLGTYDKQLLTPNGEFISYSFSTAISLFTSDLNERFAQIRGFSHGKESKSSVDFGDNLRISSMICSEAFSPSLVRELIDRSDIITALNSASIFRGADSIVTQQMAAFQFRAAENAIPLLASINMGRSYAIDSSGNVLQKSKNISNNLLTGTVLLSDRDTWYNRTGDWPIILISALLLAIFSIRKINEYKA